MIPDRPNLLDGETLETDLAVLGEETGGEPKQGRASGVGRGGRAEPARTGGTDAGTRPGERAGRKAD